jgi:hypothetical protein
MKIFNVLFPYPDPLPIETNEHTSLQGFFDGNINVEKFKEREEDCRPDKLKENIAIKKSDITREAMEKNDFNDIQEL